MNLGRQILSSMCFSTYTKQTNILNSSKQHKYYSIDGVASSPKLCLRTKTTKDWGRSDNFDAISGFAVFGATLLAYGVYTRVSK